MRIGIDFTSAINQTAGIGRFTRGFIKALADLDATNQYVLIHAKTDRINEAFAWPQNFVVKPLPLNEWTLNVLWHRARLPLQAQLFTGPLDIFHAPDYTLPPVSGSIGIVTVHDLSFMLFPEQADPGLVRYLTKAVPRSIGRAKVVLADSENTKKDLICLLGVPQEKIHVVYGGVDSHFKLTDDTTIREAVLRRHGLEGKFIMTVGTLQPRKNLTTLVEVFSSLRKANRLEHRLAVVGARGWLYDDFFDRVEQEGLTDCIKVLGFIPDEDLPILMGAADVFVFPSLYEGFGLPPLEAMACGAPVVCSNSSSLPEIVGDAGLLVDPLDKDGLAKAIMTFVDNSAFRRQKIQEGLVQAAKFSWAKTAERTLEIYEMAASSKP